MSAATPDEFFKLIVSRRAHALLAADTLMKLIVKAGELGELEARTVVGWDGMVRTAKFPPARWLSRIADACHRGAFERYPVEEIVDRILMVEATS